MRVRRRDRDRSDYLIMGIFVGFVGGALDNLYWAIPWTCEYLQLDATQSWIMNGVYPNIVSRQLCGGIAGYCHVRAALSPASDAVAKLSQFAEQGREMLRRLLIVSLVGGVAFAAGLWAIRHWMGQ